VEFWLRKPKPTKDRSPAAAAAAAVADDDDDCEVILVA